MDTMRGIWPMILFSVASATPCTTTPDGPVSGATNRASETISASIIAPDMTIAITNSYGAQLSLAFGNGLPTYVVPNDLTSSPAWLTEAVRSQTLGSADPTITTFVLPELQPTVLADGSSTQYIFPDNWAGRITIGHSLNANGSKIEGSNIVYPDIDVSYVDGYSVPITCSSQDEAITGCNIELFNQPGITCDGEVQQGPVCPNTARDRFDTQPPLFFKACEGAAYTYPTDDEANVWGLQNELVSCCIGTTCPPPARQPGTTGIETT